MGPSVTSQNSWPTQNGCHVMFWVLFLCLFLGVGVVLGVGLRGGSVLCF